MFNPQLGRELIISLDVAKAKAYGTYRVEQSVPLSISPSTKNLFEESVLIMHLNWTCAEGCFGRKLSHVPVHDGTAQTATTGHMQLTAIYVSPWDGLPASRMTGSRPR
jgi:hypothetical protein